MSLSAKIRPLISPPSQSTSCSSSPPGAFASALVAIRPFVVLAMIGAPSGSEEDAQVLGQHDVLVERDRAPADAPAGSRAPQQVVALTGPQVDLVGQSVAVAEE